MIRCISIAIACLLHAFIIGTADAQSFRLWVKDVWVAGRNGKYAPDYTVFSEDGTLLGRYHLPRGEYNRASVTEAGTEYVVVMMSSRENGVSVVVQSISPAR